LTPLAFPGLFLHLEPWRVPGQKGYHFQLHLYLHPYHLRWILWERFSLFG
jgi:hypothetical protein